ncbi:hypothetical protein ACFP47_09335 [Nesterenkonia lacusekhoensis]|uniref:Zn-dependent M16 (Insulinase) family peptidase n=1 Tax=Nesterenkonia lacusekhoensis TaxID=150832 RepID=A0ABS4SYV6_9MICC|nr:hypothetical protein [Nesterenkonia lacusekhoensis]MBP2317382.1 Zn-dependent M16 (insulinase) family peptidase [Nesterenkonia lacusekhoensis]
MSDDTRTLAEKLKEELAAMLAERGITEDQRHQENLDREIQRVKNDQERPAEERINDFETERHGNLDSALLKHLSAIIREFTQNGITVISEEEEQLADDFEQAELDYVRMFDVHGIVTDDEKAAIEARRIELFARLGKMLPGIWV